MRWHHKGELVLSNRIYLKIRCRLGFVLQTPRPKPTPLNFLYRFLGRKHHMRTR